MLCRKIKEFTTTKSTLKNAVLYGYLVPSYLTPKRCTYRDIFGTLNKTHWPRRNMSSFKIVWKDLSAFRLWSVWMRSYLISNVLKRCRRERGVKEVLQCFRHTFLRPRRTLLLAATAAYHRTNDEQPPASCNSNITDEDLQALLTELVGVDELSRRTLFCAGCGHRVLIDKKHPGVHYCTCNNGSQLESLDGWVPYMEAEDVIIWRKEYKPGQGLYAYKVYGRYGEVAAADFAAVQVDGAYRRQWDTAVASLSVVERRANGLPDQAVLHWEVLWPRLFANRDYVYIRRHKEYEVRSVPAPHKDGLFAPPPPPPPTTTTTTTTTTTPHHQQRPSVHSNAKRKAMEAYNFQQAETTVKDNKVYVIISRSCEHPKVPVSKHAIRVSEYWSHMVIKTLDGPDKTGMEFVLTYYDEPAVGGLPHGVATWATGRAAPAYLQRMRAAAHHYRTARTHAHAHEELPDFTPFVPSPTDVSYEEDNKSSAVSEEDMESSKQGPELNGNSKSPEISTRDQGTQTDHHDPTEVKVKVTSTTHKDTGVGTDGLTSDMNGFSTTLEEDNKSSEENNGSWWRYLYPFYYFV